MLRGRERRRLAGLDSLPGAPAASRLRLVTGSAGCQPALPTYFYRFLFTILFLPSYFYQPIFTNRFLPTDFYQLDQFFSTEKSRRAAGAPGKVPPGKIPPGKVHENT
jgi:hypothetical protein